MEERSKALSSVHFENNIYIGYGRRTHTNDLADWYLSCPNVRVIQQIAHSNTSEAHISLLSLTNNGYFKPGIRWGRQPYQNKHPHDAGTDDKPSVRTANTKETVEGGSYTRPLDQGIQILNTGSRAYGKGSKQSCLVQHPLHLANCQSNLIIDSEMYRKIEVHVQLLRHTDINRRQTLIMRLSS